jgi:serine/threonine protein kinase
VGRAHDLGGVHRDLKPANIFIERDDQDRDLIKVLDFGLVKPAGKKAKGSSLTLSGFVLGTPFYMSPEQAMGDKLDATADVYSLGIMLYEMLTGVPPFRGDTVAEILAKHMEASPAPMAANNPRLLIPARLEALVRACLEKVPTARPPTMFELAQNLEAIRVALVAANATTRVPEASQQRDPSGLRQTLKGWDPNRSSGDVPIPQPGGNFPDQWHESGVE